MNTKRCNEWVSFTESKVANFLLTCFFFHQEMIQDVTSLYADLVKAAFFPSSPAVLTVPTKEKQGVWHTPVDGMGAWLPSCVRYVRYTTLL